MNPTNIYLAFKKLVHLTDPAVEGYLRVQEWKKRAVEEEKAETDSLGMHSETIVFENAHYPPGDLIIWWKGPYDLSGFIYQTQAREKLHEIARGLFFDRMECLQYDYTEVLQQSAWKEPNGEVTLFSESLTGEPNFIVSSFYKNYDYFWYESPYIRR